MKKSDIARSFSHAAKTYDSHAFLQNEIANRLLERLDSLMLSPNMILDLGCGTGLFTQVLRSRFPNATIIGLDIAEGMIAKASQQASELLFCTADMEHLPFLPGTFDLVFSNCTLQWCLDYPALMKEVHDTLSPEGVFLFSSFGPNTLIELRSAFATVSDHVHVNEFIDMHHLGDALLQQQMENPVMDREDINIEYQSVWQLMEDLKKTGAHNMHANRHKEWMGKSQLKKMADYYQTHFPNAEGGVNASYEVIYGYAKSTEHSSAHEYCADELTFPLKDLAPVN